MKIPKKGSVVLRFTAEWCPPCKQLKPVIAELKDENKEVEFVDIDVDEESTKDLLSEYAIKGIPRLIFLREGKIQSDLTGFNPKEIIQQHIDLLAE